MASLQTNDKTAEITQKIPVGEEHDFADVNDWQQIVIAL
jgi:hypothetical protein